jgi:cell division protein FtsL
VRRSKTKASHTPAKRKRSLRLKFLLIFLALIFFSCVYIWQRVTVITLSARTKELRLEIKQKQKIRKYLQIEVTQLSSIQRIEEMGKEMGFVYPNLDQIGLIHESYDSTYLETPGLAKNIWAKLKTFPKNLLSVGDEAIAKEIKHEP